MTRLIYFVSALFFISFSYGKYTYETKYIDVPLDHFSFFDNRTFRLRYLINDTFWKPNYGPIFFYTGNEGDIEVFAQNTGFLWESAEIFKALIVFAEHRYYGKSLPPKNYTKDSNYFSYLSTQQALADYADVLYELKNYQKFSPHSGVRSSRKRANPVIAFGGSYGGMLAAWMRIKYPAVIEGALAASAPILQFTGITPCDSYNKVLTDAFNASSPQCVKNIRNSWRVLRKLLAEDDGKQWITKNWKLCAPIKSEENITQLINVLSELYSAVSMVNYPYPTDFLMPLPANPVNEMCKYLNSSIPDDELLSAIFESISLYLNYTGNTQCFDWSTDPFGDIAATTWNIQACSEIIMPFCSNGITDMFEPAAWNLTQYAEECYKTYKAVPNERYIEEVYGGKDLRYSSNIIFSNGLLDPWSSGGVLEKLSNNILVVILRDTAHHLDLRATNEHDPESVTLARQFYVNVFRRWIKNYRKKLNAADVEYDDYLNSIRGSILIEK
ncbi:lysosomal Pro-X carboxypeptidase-like [Planococcus citri]|uniref:lysosomal Pro-X carboxypeptidase-like n=1 Tax=Planococcus citri TaxID=170843 RepID=UPI0031F803B8